MSLTNPTINPPRLASYQARKPHSRSPSRSPPRKHDPLLRDLSPTKTVRAFAKKKSGDLRNDALARSIEHASPSQRALGSKVAQACADLRTWTRELEAWDWPGTFDFPEPARKKQRMSDMTILSRTDSDDQKADEHWGSLPASTVQVREKRIEEICADFDAIDFEQLKAFVLSAHSRAGIGEASIDDSIGTIGAATDLKRLDDFTALITATILQALPYLPKLTRLLDTWTTRLSILRSTPKYLRDLKKARTDLDHGWAALAISHKQAGTATLTSESLEEMKSLISTNVYSLGKRLDRFLDMLEGRPEVVPDSWIDDFEDLEHEYGEWVVKAERKVLEGEWKSMKEQVRETALSLILEDERDRETEDLSVLRDAEVARTQDVSFHESTRGMTTIVGPTTTTQSTIDDDGNYYTSHATSGGSQFVPITTTVRTTISGGPTSNPSGLLRFLEDEVPPSPTRHIPIQTNYSHPDEPLDTNDRILPNETLSRTTSKPTNQTAPVTSSVKERAAFLNGDIEKGESLIKGKSAPIVRPFEHASNAFTRLFKRQSKDLQEYRDNHGRTGSDASKRSAEKKGNRASSLFSGSGSSSKVSSSTGNASNRMVYMDMVSVPAEYQPKPPAPEKARGRDRTEKKDVGGRMAYGDLVMALPPPNVNPSRRSVEGPAPTRMQAEDELSGRRSHDTRRAKSAGTPRKKSTDQRIAMDLVGPSVARKSAELKRSKRPTTPRGDLARMDSAPAVTTLDRRSMEEKSRSASATPKQAPEPFDLTALPQGAFQALPQAYKAEVRSPQSMKIKNVPETYRPTGLAAPIAPPIEHDQFPANWPLSATPSEAGAVEDEYSVNETEWAPHWAQKAAAKTETIASDDFEEFFVRTLPDRSASQRFITASSKTQERDFGYSGILPRPSSAPGFRSKEPRSIPERSSSRGVVPIKAVRSDLATASLPRPVSMIREEEPSKVNFDDESPDNAARYFGSQSSKRSSSTPPAPSQSRRITTPEPMPVVGLASSSQLGAVDDPIIRRASTASIESFTRNEVKSIEIPRRSIEEPISEPQTPKGRESTEVQAGSPMILNDGVEFPSPPPSLPRRRSGRSSVSSVQSSATSQPRDRLSQEAAPLNFAMSKQRGAKARSRGGVSEGVFAAKSTIQSPPLAPGEDHFDRHVSEVLDRVRAPIRFKTRSGAVTPVTKTSMKTKAERPGKNLTLAPAEASPKKATATDPEVKLYHLTQAGRAEPIKLYVRLVGEGSERVMVRVGGGWADLADYLRQYAEHHGSRTVSEGALELQTADTTGISSGSGSGKRAFSGSAFGQEPKSRSPATPTTTKSYSNTISTTSITTTTTSDSQSGGLKTQTTFDWGTTRSKPRLWLGGDSDNEEEEETISPPDSTPRSTKTSSRPYTANAASRGEGGSNVGDTGSPISPGLDGKLRSELPEQKAKWVEGMIEKAMKSASAANTGAEKGRDDKDKHFGDMGRVGGTKRVVFKQPPGAETGR